MDVQNLYYSAKNLYNSKVNFTNVLKKVVNGRKLIRAIAYVIKADIKDEGVTETVDNTKTAESSVSADDATDTKGETKS